MSNAHKQQAHREKAKAKLSVIKAKLKPSALARSAANRQAERLRALLTAHPAFSTDFDAWIESRKARLGKNE
jgi:hypothetical protein